MTAPRPISLQAVARYVAALKRETGAEVVAVRVMGDGGIEIRTAEGGAVNPADMVRMDE